MNSFTQKTSQKLFKLFLLLPILIMFAGPANAATFEVSDSSQLSSALSEAGGNGEDDLVKIKQGSYVGNFLYASTENYGITIEGGYSGDFTSREVDPANTVLDGNQTGNVLVLSSTGIGGTFEVDGVTLQNGDAINNKGGGLYIKTDYDEITLTNNTITGNSVSNDGGGVWIYATTATLTGNTITENTASNDGGGVWIYATIATLTDNTITENSAISGVGVSIAATTVTLNNNTITGNIGQHSYGGGGVNIYGASTATLTNNTITGNSADGDGGGIHIDGTSTATLTNNTVIGNTASGNGGGVWISATTAILTNNTISGNSAYVCGGGVFIHSGTSTATLTDNTITGNSAGSNGGGMYINYGATTATLTNNTITGNTAGADGGGIYINYGATTATLTNNTITGNSAGADGGGIHISMNNNSSTANIYNNIIWNNTALDQGEDMYIDNDYENDFFPSPVNLYNNDFDHSSTGHFIKRPFSIDASNVNNADPLFADSINGDYHLTQGSPCIDAGSNNAPALPGTDKEGSSRIMDGVVDMGAYEYPGITDPTRITGTVKDVFSYNPISGATVSCSFGSVTTNSLGQYTIENIPPGTYTVTISAPLYHSAIIEDVVVLVGLTYTQDADLLPITTGNVTGKVLNAEDFSATSGIQITLENATYTFTMVSNASGEFTFDYIPAGDYTLTVDSGDYYGISRDVTVTVDGTSTIDIAAIPQSVVDDIRSGFYTQEQLDQAVVDERSRWDANDDNKIGLEEAIRALQVVSGFRE